MILQLWFEKMTGESWEEPASEQYLGGEPFE
jgi:hypothetical protein